MSKIIRTLSLSSNTSVLNHTLQTLKHELTTNPILITHLNLTIDLDSDGSSYDLLIQQLMADILPTATNLTALEHLSITVLEAEEDNQLATFISYFLFALPHKEKLKTLAFDIDNILLNEYEYEDEDAPENIDYFIEGVLACTHLDTFSLSGNYIGEEIQDNLSSFISTHPMLTRLNFTLNYSLANNDAVLEAITNKNLVHIGLDLTAYLLQNYFNSQITLLKNSILANQALNSLEIGIKISGPSNDPKAWRLDDLKNCNHLIDFMAEILAKNQLIHLDIGIDGLISRELEEHVAKSLNVLLEKNHSLLSTKEIIIGQSIVCKPLAIDEVNVSQYLLRNASHLVDYPTLDYRWQKGPTHPRQLAVFNANKQHWLFNFIFLNMLFDIRSNHARLIHGFNGSEESPENLDLKKRIESDFKAISLLQLVNMIPSTSKHETAVLMKKYSGADTTRCVAEYLDGPDLHAISLVTFGLFGRQKKEVLALGHPQPTDAVPAAASMGAS